MPRTSISHTQKISLREQRRKYPQKSDRDLQQWFSAIYNQSIALSSISEILSPRYAFLDMSDSFSTNTNFKRRRTERWPELEQALFEWIQRAETQIPITGDTVKEKAQFFWTNLSCYKDQPMPSFSNGWLQKFQSRRSIKSRKQHGEESSVLNETEEAMAAIREKLSAYSLRDQFNCDESALYWKRVPDCSLSTRKIPGRKQEKARISAHFCTNADGSERLPPWYIGTARKPHAFRAAGVNINNLNLVWRSNGKGWMTCEIFEEWLRWFDIRMAGRRVILLMDNFSAHITAAEKIACSAFPLQSTEIIWLPPNTTSHYQPLDQGIIRT